MFICIHIIFIFVHIYSYLFIFIHICSYLFMFVNISDTRPITASAFRWRPCRLSRAVFALLRPPLLRRPPFSGGRGRPPRTATALRPRTGLNVRAIFFENPNHQRQVTTSITKSFSQNLDHDEAFLHPRRTPSTWPDAPS